NYPRYASLNGDIIQSNLRNEFKNKSGVKTANYFKQMPDWRFYIQVAFRHLHIITTSSNKSSCPS
ncbi:MAG: hypothetical protein KAI94_01880, partial [Anaerolineales bacterium]|nr:hypothetical protein [Anaerolineales bacterium]